MRIKAKHWKFVQIFWLNRNTIQYFSLSVRKSRNTYYGKTGKAEATCTRREEENNMSFLHCANENGGFFLLDNIK